MFFLFFLICCGDSEEKTGELEDIALEETILIETSKTHSIYKKEEIKSIYVIDSNGEDDQDIYFIDSKPEFDDISEMNETEKAQYKINRATIKTDCMVDYFNKRDLGQIDIPYEEHCK